MSRRLVAAVAVLSALAISDAFASQAASSITWRERFDDARIVTLRCDMDDVQRTSNCQVIQGGEGISPQAQAAFLARFNGVVMDGPPVQVENLGGPPVIVPVPAEPPAIAPAPAVAPALSSLATPKWVRLPNASDLERAYPPAARKAGVEGRAIIECDVEANGTLSGCRAISESPAGYGFGAAAVSVTPKFRMRPTTADGRPVGGARVRFPVRFLDL